jgi:hypothetical protein
MFKNRVLMKIFRPKRDEKTGEWGRLHHKELYEVYSSPNTIWAISSKRMRWAGHMERTGERKGAYGILVGKPEERRPLGRPRHGWEDNTWTELI